MNSAVDLVSHIKVVAPHLESLVTNQAPHNHPNADSSVSARDPAAICARATNLPLSKSATKKRTARIKNRGLSAMSVG
jgi:hypothetical protein